MRLNRRARVLRTAAVATGTSAALLLPAAAAFAAEAPAAEAPAGPAAVASDQDTTTPAASDQDGTAPAPGDQDGTAPDAGDQSVFWRNVDLADGSLAKVYQDGPGRFTAYVYGGGQLIGTLESADGKPAYGENNGLHIVLRPDGTVGSWLDTVPAPRPTPKPVPTPKPAPEPKPAPHHRAEALPRTKLADGTVATFAKHVKNGPRVQVSAVNGKRLATVDARHLTAQHRGWTYKLVPQPGKHQYRLVVVDTPKQGGNSWVYDLNGRLVAKYHAQKR
ncbi:hypothetical protein [Streptomyces sp. NRRL F-5727]|uniref:hypothetical protein n=1 Tax=Streptomyces sp. NRRL F-5727 TaxID=1463871 RepID=UPI0004C7611E|nr:hypothetical protein [Streptomyces sp. NRRL F-5727]